MSIKLLPYSKGLPKGLDQKKTYTQIFKKENKNSHHIYTVFSRFYL